MATYNYELKLPQNTGQFSTGSYGVFHECSFSKDVVITSLFWYRGVTGTNPIVYPRIYSSNGVVLGTGSGITESTGASNSWYKVDLNSPVTLNKDTSYYIGFYFVGNTPLGYYNSQSFPQNFSTDDGRVEVKVTGTKQNTSDAFPTTNNPSTRICIGFSIGYYEEINKILLSSGGKYFSATKDNSKYALVPQMTSNTAPSGVASSADSSTIAFRAFREGQTYVTATNVKTGHVQYEFPVAQVINRYSLFAGSTVGALTQNITAWTFLGSDNGSTWIELDRQTGVNWDVVSEKKEFEFKNITKYKMYRLSFTDSGNNSANNAYVRELQFNHIDEVTPIKLDKAREVEFLNYGFDKVSPNRIFSKLIEISAENTNSGSGKTFEHTIDMSKRRVDKITLG